MDAVMGYAIHGPIVDPLQLDDAELLALFPEWPAVCGAILAAVYENDEAGELTPAPGHMTSVTAHTERIPQ